MCVKLGIQVFYGENSNMNHKQKDAKFPCYLCDYKARKKGTLQVHIHSNHRGVKFPCNQCDYRLNVRQICGFIYSQSMKV